MKNTLLFGGGITILVLLGAWWMSAPSSDSPIVSQGGLHWHPELEIYVGDEKQEIPQDLGLINGHSPIHTHDDMPIIHLEFGGLVREEDIMLSRFFEVWGEEFSSTSLLGNTGEVEMRVNGELNTEYGSYVMKDGDRIELRI